VRLAGEFLRRLSGRCSRPDSQGLGYEGGGDDRGRRVLGFDFRSGPTDHDWGRRMMGFLEDERQRTDQREYGLDEMRVGGRCAEEGDELGRGGYARAARADLMRLWMLISARYPRTQVAWAETSPGPGGAGLARTSACGAGRLVISEGPEVPVLSGNRLASRDRAEAHKPDHFRDSFRGPRRRHPGPTLRPPTRVSSARSACRSHTMPCPAHRRRTLFDGAVGGASLQPPA